MPSTRASSRPLLAALLLLALVITLVTVGPAHAGHAADEAAPRAERVQIGTSVRGRPIIAVHRWTDGATRTLLVVGSMHGDERAGSRVVRRLRSEPLPAGVHLWLVPTMNPDGAAAGRRTNARGVDLNRNFPRHWRRAGADGPTWSGPRPASEPETKAMMALVRRVEPDVTVAFHQPLFGVDSYRAKSLRLVRRLARETGLPVKSFDCGGVCHGTFTDWHNGRTPGAAVTVELGRRVSDRRVARMGTAVLTVARR